MSVDPHGDQERQMNLEQNLKLNMDVADALMATLENKIKYTNIVQVRIQEYEKLFGVTDKLQAAKNWLSQQEFDYEVKQDNTSTSFDVNIDEEKSFDASEDSFDPDDIPERGFDPDLAADKDVGSDSDSEEWDPCDVMDLEDIRHLLPDF
jgi:hypothetical protein